MVEGRGGVDGWLGLVIPVYDTMGPGAAAWGRTDGRCLQIYQSHKAGRPAGRGQTRLP